jgi:hypothetical protein
MTGRRHRLGRRAPASRPDRALGDRERAASGHLLAPARRAPGPAESQPVHALLPERGGGGHARGR